MSEVRRQQALSPTSPKVIPRAQWYRDMAAATAQLHYISNSPWELAPVVRAFLWEAGLPSGQILLKQVRNT
jgi:phosphatidate phosphatase APP1